MFHLKVKVVVSSEGVLEAGIGPRAHVHSKLPE
jgi:hypothetical protein